MYPVDRRSVRSSIKRHTIELLIDERHGIAYDGRDLCQLLGIARHKGHGDPGGHGECNNGPSLIPALPLKPSVHKEALRQPTYPVLSLMPPTYRVGLYIYCADRDNTLTVTRLPRTRRQRGRWRLRQWGSDAVHHAHGITRR